MRQTTFGVGATLALSLALGACDSPAEEPAKPEARPPEVIDSAGVRIVVNHADTAALPRWTVDTVPLVRIGRDDADIHQQFVQIDITDPVPGHDRRFNQRIISQNFQSESAYHPDHLPGLSVTPG